MRFLLVTCVVSDFAQVQPETLERVKAALPDDLAASALTEMEVAYGLLLNPRLARRLEPVAVVSRSLEWKQSGRRSRVPLRQPLTGLMP